MTPNAEESPSNNGLTPALANKSNSGIYGTVLNVVIPPNRAITYIKIYAFLMPMKLMSSVGVM